MVRWSAVRLDRLAVSTTCHAERREHGNGENPSGQTYLQMKPIEKDDRIPLRREVPSLPGGEERFHPPTIRETALFDRCASPNSGLSAVLIRRLFKRRTPITTTSA